MEIEMEVECIFADRIHNKYLINRPSPNVKK